MFSTRSLIAVILALGVSACVSSTPPASRGAMVQQPNLTAGASQSSGGGETAVPDGTVYLQSQFDVEAIRVTVPRSLKVSEANTFKPRADIVWHGEPLGDRYVQVAAIFNDAMLQGTAAVQKGRKVDLDIEVTYFHALTEKTRYTIGGVHEMQFVLTVRDAMSGAVIDGPREIVADVKAAGGAEAIAEEQVGRTQRVVTVERLASVIRRELSAPVSQEQLVSRQIVPQTVLGQ